VFSALDDDAGSASDTIKVLITGNEDDGQPNGTPDTAFHQAMQTAESVRLNRNATQARIDARRAIVQSINVTT
jgi:hypothetical protein